MTRPVGVWMIAGTPRSTRWKVCTTEQIAAWIDGLHAAHNASHHTTIGGKGVMGR